MVREINYNRIGNSGHESFSRGMDLERGFLGDAKVEILPEELGKIKKPFSIVKFIELVKKYQPKDWDPADPRPRIANDLHFLVFQELERKGLVKDAQDLKFYTARGSILDKKFSTDCFFDYFDAALKKNVYLTIDIKYSSLEGLQSGYVKESKAGYILNIDLEMPGENKNEWQKILQGKAVEIAEKFDEIRQRI